MIDGTVAETPEVVCICGSMRFKDLMLTVAERETAEGRIVLMPFSVVAQADQGGEFKAMLDRLHRAKIDLSDSVIVVTDESGYFGESTRCEIAYAEGQGKPARLRKVRAAQPATVDDTALRKQIVDVFRRESLTPDTAYVEADMGVLLHGLMAVVQPVLAAKGAEVERLRTDLAKAQKRAEDNDGLWRKSALETFDVCYIVGQALRRNGVEVVDPPVDERVVVAVVRQLIAEFEQRPRSTVHQCCEDVETLRAELAALRGTEVTRRWRDAEGHVWTEMEPGQLTGRGMVDVPYLDVAQGYGLLTALPPAPATPATEPAEAEQDEPASPEWCQVACCEAGMVAYPSPCPWHGKEGHPAAPATEPAGPALTEGGDRG